MLKKFERKDLFNVFLWNIQIEKISFLIKRNLLFCVWQLIRFLFFSFSTFLTKEEFLFFCSHFLASFSDKRIFLPLLISVCLYFCLSVSLLITFIFLLIFLRFLPLSYFQSIWYGFFLLFSFCPTKMGFPYFSSLFLSL